MDRFRRGDLTFRVLDAGPADGEPVVLLHGFPQDSASWDGVVPPLHRAGLRTLALDQRGYSPGARPRRRSAYRLPECAADVVALLDAAGLESAHVVGHDWGGAVAWRLASDHPERLRTLTILSTPHPAAMTRAFFRSRQLLQSGYMFAFLLPVLPERFLRRSDRIRSILERSGLPAPYLGRYVRHLADPAAVRGALGWYRAIPWGVRDQVRRSTVPTTYVWGNRDAALGRTAAESTARFVSAPYEFVELDAAHWLPETRPAEVAEQVLRRVNAPT